MGKPVEVLETEVLQLTRAERIRLLDRVVASLDADAARDAAWDKLATSRQADAASDPSQMLDIEDVLARLRADLQ